MHAGAPGGQSPSELRVFTNRDDLDFGSASDLPPVQRWDLAENMQGDIELPCNVRTALQDASGRFNPPQKYNWEC